MLKLLRCTAECIKYLFIWAQQKLIDIIALVIPTIFEWVDIITLVYTVFKLI